MMIFGWNNIKKFYGDNSIINLSIVGVTVRATGMTLLFTMTVLLARTMSIDEYGQFALLLSSGFIMVLFAGLGIPTASNRIVSRYMTKHKIALAEHYLIFGLATTTATSLLCGVLLSCIINFVPNISSGGRPAPAAVIGLVIALALVRLVGDTSRSCGFQITGFIAESVSPRLLMIVIILAYYYRNATISLNEAITAYSICHGIAALAAIVRMMSHLTWNKAALNFYPLRLYRSWISLSTTMLVTPVYYFLLFETDIITLGMLSDSYNVALYQVARRLAEFSVFCVSAISAVGLPRLASASSSRSTTECQATINTISSLSILTTFPISAGLIMFGGLALRVFGVEFANAYPVLLTLTLARTFAVILGPSSEVLMMTGHHRRLGSINITFGIGNVLLNAILVPWFNALGAAIATSAILIGWSIRLYFLLRKITPYDTCFVRVYYSVRPYGRSGEEPPGPATPRSGRPPGGTSPSPKEAEP